MERYSRFIKLYQISYRTYTVCELKIQLGLNENRMTFGLQEPFFFFSNSEIKKHIYTHKTNSVFLVKRKKSLQQKLMLIQK